MGRIETVVVGAGVIGLAIARVLALAGQEVLLLDQAEAIGTETSSRNSEVIHAGIHYPAGSLKARLCVRGRQMLYAFAAARGVPHRRSGKLIVATSPEQEAALAAIREGAAKNGVEDLRLLGAAEVAALEPDLRVTAALLSPSTGIIDSHQLMLALLADAQAAGTVLALNTRVEAVRPAPGGFVLAARDRVTGEATDLSCRRLINAAGLHAVALARAIEGLDPLHVPTAYFARGNYFGLAARPRFRHLVYPVPEPGGLGVHLTLDLAGAMRFGPDVEWIEAPDHRVNPARLAHFETEIRRYWPDLPEGALAASYCGIRPKISGPGEPAADFRIDGPARHGLPGLVNLFGIESPGLTSCLAIAEEVCALIEAEAEAAA